MGNCSRLQARARSFEEDPHDGSIAPSSRPDILIMAAGDTFLVEAVISKWIDGKYGPYGFAEIDSPDSPAEKALCSYKVKGLTPPLGEKFLCHIVPKGSKWRVSELLVQSLAAEVESIVGEIGDWSAKGRSKEWAIRAWPSSSAAMPPFRIDLNCLWQVHVTDIDNGTPIMFDAVRDSDGRHGYTATKLLYPTAAQALGDGSPQTVITCVLKGWDTDSDAKGVGVAVRAPGACVAASVFVPAHLLRGAGLRRLKRAEKPTAPPPGDSDDLLDQWQTVLRTGSEAERERLAVDRLELELEWVESSSQWKVTRLIRPRAVRLPGKPKEVIDWVAGTVVSKPEVFKDNPPEGSPDTEDSGRH